MPIEVNRINRECTKCKNSTLFETDKGKFFCSKCLTTFSADGKEEIAEKIEIEFEKIANGDDDFKIKDNEENV